MHPSPYATPGSIGPSSVNVEPNQKSSESKDIWTAGEIESRDNYDYEDSRPQPEYEMIFKQSVGTEDIYLGMGAKNPTTASCEHLVVSDTH